MTTLLRLLTALTCLVTLTASAADASPESLGFDKDRLARLDRYLVDQIDSGHIPGAVVLLARHGQIAEFRAFGQADPDRGTAMDKDTIFRVYSQTKVVTGVAMMMLFEQGKWHFDDPVTRFIPEFSSLRVLKRVKDDGSFELEDLQRPPTMRELLTHSAGFAYGLDQNSPLEKAWMAADFMHAANTDAAIARIAGLPMASQPGLHWRYSAAVDIQGYIIERITGMRLGEFMQKRIFGPLQMQDTAFSVPADKRSRLVALKAYDADSQKVVDAPPGPLVWDFTRTPAIDSGGAGLVSTAHDYARLAQMLDNGGELDGVRILAPGTVALMAANHLADAIRDQSGEPFAKASGWGFGVDVAMVEDRARGGTLRGNGSFDWGGAAGTWFWIDPANDIVFVGMIQVMNRWSDPRLQHIDAETASLVYGALVDPSR